ncbi:MAG: hypothetical protein U0R52_12025 [Solirubrobacterales bacterium]
MKRIAGVAALASMLSFSAAASPAVSPAAASHILYTTQKAIVSVSPQGGDRRVLFRLRGGGRVFSPSATRGGGRIAFLESVITNSGGPNPPRTADRLFVMRRDGSHLRLVRKFIDLDVQSLEISPNGRRLVFSKMDRVFDSTQFVYTVRVNGRGLRRLTRSRAAGTDPQFSPNGRRVVYTKGGGRHHDGIATVRLSGGRGHLIFRSSSASQPSYSPDGRRIAFVNAGPGGFYHAWIMRSRGGRAHALIHNRSQQFHPDFSPSGRSLVYEQERLPVVEWTIRTVRRDGSRVRVVLHHGNDPAWVR